MIQPREWSDLPIIVLAARERETEKIEALNLGADDYVNKPFNVGEAGSAIAIAEKAGICGLLNKRLKPHKPPHYVGGHAPQLLGSVF